MKRFNLVMILVGVAILHVFEQDIPGEWQSSLKAG